MPSSRLSLSNSRLPIEKEPTYRLPRVHWSGAKRTICCCQKCSRPWTVDVGVSAIR